MFDQAKLLLIISQAGNFMAAFAAIAAGIIITRVTKKFGTGILASGFKTISKGVFLVGAGIILDTISSYLQISNNAISAAILVAKELFFIVGTYTIVIGSKKTGDKLEALTQ